MSEPTKSDLDALEDRLKRHITATVNEAEAIWSWSWMNKRSGLILNIAGIAALVWIAFKI